MEHNDVLSTPDSKPIFPKSITDSDMAGIMHDFSSSSPLDTPVPVNQPPKAIPANGSRTTGGLRSIMARDVPRPPFAGQKLGRSEIERLLVVSLPGDLDLRGADLREADLSYLNLAGVRFGDDDPIASDTERLEMAAKLDRAKLVGAHLEGIIAPAVCFDGADMRAIHLKHANLMGASLVDVYMPQSDLSETRLTDANLSNATLTDAVLTNAVMVGVKLVGAHMRNVHLEGTDLGLANLSGADLRFGHCDEQTHCGGARLEGAFLDGLRFRDMDLTAIDWTPVHVLGEEVEASSSRPGTKIPAYRVAARLYRRLGLALRAQGMTTEGSRFIARGRVMERRASWSDVAECWHGRRYLAIVPSLLKWVDMATPGIVTAYGEHPAWAIVWAGIITVVFSGLYMLTSPTHLTIGASILLSLSALLGHGYASLPDLFVSGTIVPYFSIVEAACGSVLLLLFTLALARRTMS